MNSEQMISKYQMFMFERPPFVRPSSSDNVHDEAEHGDDDDEDGNRAVEFAVAARGGVRLLEMPTASPQK